MSSRKQWQFKIVATKDIEWNNVDDKRAKDETLWNTMLVRDCIWYRFQ